MIDCHTDIRAYYKSKITLSQTEQTEMRERRDANRRRLTAGLLAAEKPLPYEFASQGSYTDRTMVQYPGKQYDIDDGAYFDAEVLVGSQGAELSALAARQMVRDALSDGKFKTPPYADTHCVVIQYDAGYKVDMPVYRRVQETDFLGNVTDEYFELAGATWIRSDARDVTPWFNETNKRLSPDDVHGRQFRRTVREIKKFAVSRDSWRTRILTGFGITILASECFAPAVDRDDIALRNTLDAMRRRLDYSLKLQCPVPPYDWVTGPDDAKANYFLKQLNGISEWLASLSTCHDKNDALKFWSKVYNDSFFTDRQTIGESAHTSKDAETASISLGAGLLGVAALAAVAHVAGSSRQDAQAEPSEPVRKGGSRTNA